MSHTLSQTTEQSRKSQWILVIGLITVGLFVVFVQLFRSLVSAQPAPSDPAAATGGEKQAAPAATERIYRDPGGPGRRF